MQKHTISNRKARSSKHILRPRTAFNFFYSHQRDIILNERLRATKTKAENTCDNGSTNNKTGCALLRRKPHGKSQGTHHLTKIVAERWKEVGTDKRKKYEIMAEKDRIRYSKAMMSMKKPGQEFSIPKYLKSDSFENHEIFAQEANIAKQAQIIDGRGICANADELLHIHDNLRNDEKDLDNTIFLLKSTVNPCEYIDGLGIKWSATELDILKQLL